MSKLITPYIDKMDKKCPHEYHPTPQFQREGYVLLNGEWDFAFKSVATSQNYPEKILVPFPPESVLSGIESAVLPEHYMHYRKLFTLPEGFKNKRVFLHFGAVDQTCTVYLNDTELGSHEGGYSPFCFEITNELQQNDNEIKLVAKDGLDHKYPYGSFLFYSRTTMEVFRREIW